MQSNRPLLAILGIAFAIELLLSCAGFAAPAATLSAFAVAATPDTLFLGHVVAWLLLVVALTCGYALLLVRRGEAAGWTLSFLLGAWWVGIGLALGLGYGKTPNLVLDTVKGALILAAAWASRPRASRA